MRFFDTEKNLTWSLTSRHRLTKHRLKSECGKTHFVDDDITKKLCDVIVCTKS